MGEQNIIKIDDESVRRRFMKSLLEDVRALESMLSTDMFERGIRRIGAEQEMFIVDKACRPSNIAMEVLDTMDDPRFTHELGKFNLEANLSPQVMGGKCLSKMEEEANQLVVYAREKVNQLSGDIALVGVLPTLNRSDLSLDSMISMPRYFALNDELKKLRGSDFQIAIKGIDQIDIKHENLMLEACNASFQVHFQVAPEEFAQLYNLALAVTGPVLAAAVNSSLLFGRRLWNETRIAIFEYSVDARSDAHQARGHKPRVHFGDHWIDQSVVEIFQEDIARFRVVITGEEDEPSSEMIARGEIPQLSALKLHTGTVYRWNRACYGVTEGKAHLRIENRVLPAGPTVLDEMANAAFFFGLLSALSHEVEDIRKEMQFSDVKSNFFAAARDGLKAQQTWFDSQHMPAAELITKILVPLARKGLEQANIDHHDIERYIDVIEKRTLSGRTGAKWLLESYQTMEDGTADQKARSLTSAVVSNQKQGHPIHEWELAQLCPAQDWRESFRTVGQFMTTDLFTVRADDLIDFAASLMEWRHIRHVPVEDDQGKLVGLVSHRALLRIVARGLRNDQQVAVRDIMRTDPDVVTPDTLTVEAIRLMRNKNVGCLPVVKNNHLVGIITQRDLITVASRLLEEHLVNLN